MNTDYLHTALELAHKAIGLSSPNPRVGCVLVKDGRVIGQGFTQAAGQAHAEVMAIRDAQSQNHDTAGASAYVTLEPCSHHGRTPPCVNALIQASVTRVIIACLDPNPLVAGAGVANLRAAGILVEVLPAEHALAQAAYELNIGFMKRMRQGSVFTRLKWAQSADGKTALPDGRSQWITGADARSDGHRYRARADVLVTGVGTVLHDNPQLNVRGVSTVHPPLKCVLDSWARLPAGAQVFDDGAPVLLVCAQLEASHPLHAQLQSRIEVLRQERTQLTVLQLPLLEVSNSNGPNDVQHERMDARALWAYFAQQQFNEIHIEAGATLNAALLEYGLVDEVLMYLAPRMVGAGLGMAQFGPSVNLDDLTHEGGWVWQDMTRLGDDVRLVLRKK